MDALQAFGISDEETSLAKPPAPSGPPPHIVVASATKGSDGVVADDVGIQLASEYRIDLARRLRRAEATGKAGEITTIELEDDITEQLLVLGMGDGSPTAARDAGAKLAAKLEGSETVLCAVTASLSHHSLRAFCEGLLLASYRFSRKSEAKPPKETTVQLAVAGLAAAQRDLDRALITARAVWYARDLANRPSNEKNPEWLAQEATQWASTRGLRVRVLDELALAKGGFGGLLAVGSGSATPPRLVIMSYKGEPNAPHVVLVGKGITFDSGGLSLKPPDGMPLMKTDMSGAAAVLATMSALSELDVRANVTGILACAENMPGGSSYRPGDVIRHYGGRTSEVLNTDAEGRLVLADALAYSVARLRPDAIVDIATLTGAATLGLSRVYGALYSDDDGLAEALSKAGVESNDRVWQMPLVTEYRNLLDSAIADISHVSGKSYGGSITAALFLKEFTAKHPRWAHLDIAGPARAEAPRAELVKGATGFGVRLLLRWLEAAPELY